jgi:hypothetical protein
MHQAADAIARLALHALRTGCDRLLVDTCGLVEGDLGRALKRIKIERVAPDLVIALQRADECEPILSAYAGAGRPAIVRLPAAATTPRSAAARRRQRERMLAEHLAGAVPAAFDLTQFEVRSVPWGRGLAGVDLVDMLVGLDGRDGWTLGLGCISAVDIAKARLTIDTALDPARVRRWRSVGSDFPGREPGASAPRTADAARRRARRGAEGYFGSAARGRIGRTARRAARRRRGRRRRRRHGRGGRRRGRCAVARTFTHPIGLRFRAGGQQTRAECQRADGRE